MQISTGVFERKAAHTMSERVFFALIGGILLYGLGLTSYLARWAVENGIYLTGFSFFLVGLGIPFLGIMIGIKSDNPLISFIGYNLVVIPFGIVLGPVLSVYSPNVINKALLGTFSATAFMSILAFVHPGIFKNLGRALFFSLMGLVVVRFLQIFIPALRLGIIDWLAAGIFTLYIGYDLYRAQRVSRNLDNAVDFALQIYLDIINLFLTLLRIFGRED